MAQCMWGILEQFGVMSKEFPLAPHFPHNTTRFPPLKYYPKVWWQPIHSHCLYGFASMGLSLWVCLYGLSLWFISIVGVGQPLPSSYRGSIRLILAAQLMQNSIRLVLAARLMQNSIRLVPAARLMQDSSFTIPPPYFATSCLATTALACFHTIPIPCHCYLHAGFC